MTRVNIHTEIINKNADQRMIEMGKTHTKLKIIINNQVMPQTY